MEASSKSQQVTVAVPRQTRSLLSNIFWINKNVFRRQNTSLLIVSQTKKNVQHKISWSTVSRTNKMLNTKSLGRLSLEQTKMSNITWISKAFRTTQNHAGMSRSSHRSQLHPTMSSCPSVYSLSVSPVLPAVAEAVQSVSTYPRLPLYVAVNLLRLCHAALTDLANLYNLVPADLLERRHLGLPRHSALADLHALSDGHARRRAELRSSQIWALVQLSTVPLWSIEISVLNEAVFWGKRTTPSRPL